MRRTSFGRGKPSGVFAAIGVTSRMTYSRGPWTPHVLSDGYIVELGWTKSRKGHPSRHRFLVLAPKKPGSNFRATSAAGDLVDGACVPDHGVLSSEQRAAIEHLAAEPPS